MCAYNGDESHVLEWSQFLAFLSGRRSPYVTVSLFPKSTDDEDEKEGGEEEEREREEELQISRVDQDGGATPKYVGYVWAVFCEGRRGGWSVVSFAFEACPFTVCVPLTASPIPVCVYLDRWDQPFAFVYAPSWRASCPILLTEVLRLSIAHKPRYMVLMLRQKPRGGQVFLTAYDPKAAKEYVCR